MITFNLLPLFPLDGYRFINDLFLVDKKILISEVFILIGLLCILCIIIVSFIMRYYGIILICLYLMYLNIKKLESKRRSRISSYYQMLYEIKRYSLK